MLQWNAQLKFLSVTLKIVFLDTVCSRVSYNESKQNFPGSLLYFTLLWILRYEAFNCLSTTSSYFHSTALAGLCLHKTFAVLKWFTVMTLSVSWASIPPSGAVSRFTKPWDQWRCFQPCRGVANMCFKRLSALVVTSCFRINFRRVCELV